MICADFLEGVSLEAGNRDAILPSLIRLLIGDPKPERKQPLEAIQVTLCRGSLQNGPGCGLVRECFTSFAGKFWSEMAGDADEAGEWKIFKPTTFNRAVC
jgi:hypothetical protein